MALAGASSLLFLRHKEPKTAVDLSRAGPGRHPSGGGDGFAIGAMTSIDELRRPCGGRLGAGPGGPANFVTQQVRNMSTLGGNIVRVFAWADFPVALLALGASP
jgi:CO/xanthine dehydrogenase FAD-binding subunit